MGLISIFYFSQIIFSLFYFFPKSIILVFQGRLSATAIFRSLIVPIIWISIPLIIGFLFPSIVESGIFKFLDNPVSVVICNIMILLLILSTAFTKKGRADGKADFWNTMNKYRLKKGVDINGIALAYFGDGLSFYKAKDYLLSISSFDIAIDSIQLSKGDNNALLKDAYYNRACAKDELENYEDAIIDYSKSIKLGINNESEYLNRGVARFKLQDYSKAIEDYNEAVKLNPGSAAAHYNRGLARYSTGDKEGACLDWTKAEALGNETSAEMIKKHCY